MRGCALVGSVRTATLAHTLPPTAYMLAYIRVIPGGEATPPPQAGDEVAQTAAARRRKLEQDAQHSELACVHKRAREGLSAQDLLAVQASLSEVRRRAQRPLSPDELFAAWCERNWRLEDVLGHDRAAVPSAELRAGALAALDAAAELVVPVKTTLN